MKAQGYEIQKYVIYQDNQSAMKMEINGRNSCTGNSRHIDIRFSFMKNRIDQGEISVEYCPTYRIALQNHCRVSCLSFQRYCDGL